jgi:hypothetical protein
LGDFSVQGRGGEEFADPIAVTGQVLGKVRFDDALVGIAAERKDPESADAANRDDTQPHYT